MISSHVPNGTFLPLNEGSSDPDVVWEKLEFDIYGTRVSLATVRRGGHLDPILFLHGFGSTKEDYLDVQFNKSFTGRPFIAYDTPGSGESTCPDLSKLSIAFLVDLAVQVIKRLLRPGQKFHLVGHSMGGLTGVVLAQRNPSSIPSFANIKGNLAPEDCFLSRQIFEFPAEDTEEFITQFIHRTRRSKYYSDRLYAAAFRAKVNPAAVRPTFESMVSVTDNGNLLSVFEGLPFRRMYMYGEQFASLSYLGRLAEAGVEVAEISESGHFVMFSNPIAMWKKMATFMSS